MSRTVCQTCAEKLAEVGKDECFRCRVSSVGFSFVGGGGYGRKAFAERTNTEFLNENVGFDHKTNPAVMPQETKVWS